MEITAGGDIGALKKQHPALSEMILLKDSDAHYLENMQEASSFLELPELSAQCLVQALRDKTAKWIR